MNFSTEFFYWTLWIIFSLVVRIQDNFFFAEVYDGIVLILNFGNKLLESSCFSVSTVLFFF